MDYICYIIYSKSIDRFYIGYTTDLQERLKLHNTGYFSSKSFTSRSGDWELFIVIPCETIKEALFVESRIKKKKSRQFIRNLKKYPELLRKIKKDFNS